LNSNVTKEIQQLKREIQIHPLMNHESIIKFYQFFQHNNEVFIVLEYAENGNLFNYIRKKTYQPLPSKIRKMF